MQTISKKVNAVDKSRVENGHSIPSSGNMLRLSTLIFVSVFLTSARKSSYVKREIDRIYQNILIQPTKMFCQNFEVFTVVICEITKVRMFLKRKKCSLKPPKHYTHTFSASCVFPEDLFRNSDYI